MWPMEIILLLLVATMVYGSENYFHRLDVIHGSYNFYRLSLNPTQVIIPNKRQ
jgi:hypothetical protein